MKITLLLFISLLLIVPVFAQDVPAAESVTYDTSLIEGISNEAFYDWWFISAGAGDIIVVTMAARGTLEPLIGILDPGGNLVARSEDGAPGSTVTLEYVPPADGEFTIVATRVGNENGTSTGDYELQVRRANTPVERVNPYQEVTFRCKDFEATNALTLEFAEDTEQASFYRVSVFGLDGFLPVIRVFLSTPEISDCSSDSQAINGDTISLLDGTQATYETDGQEAAQLSITGAAEAGGVTLTIGSRNGMAGRFIAVVEGLGIQPSDDTDIIRVGQGPKAAVAPLLVYMVSDKATRLDPAVMIGDSGAENPGTACDDAGRRGCEAVPSVNGLRVSITDGAVEISGGRFDAGILLPAGIPELRTFELASFSGNTEGAYTLVLIGELPAD